MKRVGRTCFSHDQRLVALATRGIDEPDAIDVSGRHHVMMRVMVVRGRIAISRFGTADTCREPLTGGPHRASRIADQRQHR